MRRKQLLAGLAGFVIFVGLSMIGASWGWVPATVCFAVLIVVGTVLTQRETERLRPPD